MWHKGIFHNKRAKAIIADLKCAKKCHSLRKGREGERKKVLVFVRDVVTNKQQWNISLAYCDCEGERGGEEIERIWKKAKCCIVELLEMNASDNMNGTNPKPILIFIFIMIFTFFCSNTEQEGGERALIKCFLTQPSV